METYFQKLLAIVKASGAVEASFEEDGVKFHARFPENGPLAADGRTTDEFNAGEQHSPGGYVFTPPQFRAAAENPK